MRLKLSTKIILIGIIFLAGVLRFYNLVWDQGYHLHPDERAIILAVEHLQYPHTLTEFFSINSGWNPHFFAYGSFPFYLLKIISSGLSIFDPAFAKYDLLGVVGRFISGISDLITLLFLFKIGKKLFSSSVGFFAAFLYAVSVLPIQLSHFYAVDTILTCLITIILYQLLLFYEKPELKRAVIIGFVFGLSLATKISAVVLVSAIGAALIADFGLIFLHAPHKPRHWLPHLPHLIKHLATYALLMAIVAIATFIFFEPYALIDFTNFWKQTQQQSAMTHDAFTFPYTLQYVGKIPYWYELKNIFLFGLGPLLATFSFIGVFYVMYLAGRRDKTGRWAKELILIVFFLTYVAVVGSFAIGFMRYMLPVYPMLSLFAAVVINKLFASAEIHGRLKNILIAYLVVGFLIWPLSFMHIYTMKNTRVTASKWITTHVPAGSTIALEHWDDTLPLFDQQKYQALTLPLYDADTPSKWAAIHDQLQQTDYLIIASNRLYTPLQKLTNCDKLPPGRCYTQSAEYYKKLFAGELGFQKVAEFTDYPTIPLLNIPINDQGADESFTVYDHPKVMIFQRTANVPPLVPAQK